MLSSANESSAKLSIFQYWDREEIPEEVGGLLDTVSSNNPDFAHRVYSEAAADELIATHFGPREQACFRACAVPSMQSDYFRYCALIAFGGIYVDADFRCVGSLRPFVEDESSAHLFQSGIGSVMAGFPVPSVIGGLLIAKQPRHPLLKMALSMATLQIERRIGAGSTSTQAPEYPGRMAWRVTGPGILKGLYFAHQLGSLDTFLDLLAGTAIEPSARTLCEVVGDRDRLARAFDRVHVSMLADCEVIRGPGFELSYKASGKHWLNFRSNPYRSPA